MIKKEFLFFSLVFISLIVFQLTSCYSPEDGCLDPEATNYSIEGDFDCLDCCVYPTASMSIFHENKDTTFKLMDTIINDLDQQVSLIDFVCLMSDFKVESGGILYEVEDQISLIVDDSETIVKDDVIRVSRNNFTYEIGTMIYEGSTDAISFKVGLNDDLNENRFFEEIDDHPLTNDPDSLFQEDTDTYVFQRIKLAQGFDFLDTVIYDISSSYDFSIEVEYESVKGEDKTVIIEAQYDKWFEGIDFNTMTQIEIQEKIGENTINVFRQKN